MVPDAMTWLNTLYPKLTARAADLQKFDDYYSGNHPLPFLTKAHSKKMRSAFRQMLEESRTNYMSLIVDVIDERLEIEGIRLSASSEPTSDKETWDVWQANGMDSLHRAAILESLIKGISYVSVWPDSNGDGYADISVEDPCETIVAYTPGTNFMKRDAALKVWCDEPAKKERANVFLPDKVYRYERRLDAKVNKVSGQGTIGVQGGTYGSQSSILLPSYAGAGSARDSSAWIPLEGDPDGPEIDNPLGVVPIVPIRNRGRLLVEGESEIATSLTTQNQINGFTFLLALAGYFGAHKQRWATGLTLIEDEKTGEVKEPFDVAIDKMIVSEDGETKFGEFAETDLTAYIKAIEHKAGQLAIKHRMPKHYFLPEGQAPSGDAINSSESGLTRLGHRKQTSVGESFEEVFKLCRLAGEKEEDTPVDSEVVWADPGTQSAATMADSTIKKFQAGLIPQEQALEDLGYTQTQINRMLRNKTTDALLNSMKPPGSMGATEGSPSPLISPNGYVAPEPAKPEPKKPPTPNKKT